MTNRISARIFVTVASLGAAYGLFNAPAAHAATDAATDTTALDEIIVTASKRSERAQDVPASISVLGSAQLQDLHATSLEDIASYAPGLVISNGGSPGQSSIILRGLNSEQNGALVATLIDDSPVGSSAGWVREDAYQLDLLPYDIERIEVLRGPQGTLYGANSMGGVLKYVTKNPDLNQSQAQVGGDGFGIAGGGDVGYAARGMVSVPIVDGKAAIRISLYDRRTPGYIDNPLRGVSNENGLTQRGGRIALLWQPTDALSFKLQDLYQETNSEGNATDEAQRLGTTTPYRVGNWLGDLTYNHVLAEPFNQATNFLALAINWNLGFAEFTSASSFSNKHLSQMTDYSNNIGYLIPILDPTVPPTTSTLSRFDLKLSTKRYTQEFRLASPSGGRFEWLIGAFYTNETSANHQILDAFNSDMTLIPALTPFLDFSAPTTYKESAVFGNVTYRISDAFDVTAGLRQSKNTQTNDQISGGFLLSPPSNVYATAAQSVTNYAVSPRFHFNSDNMIYVRVATGYRPGGPNDAIPGYPDIPTQTNADRITNYEAGIKTEFLERRASIDFAVYKILWSDLQSSAYTPDGNFSYSVNNGTASSQGFELSTFYAPIQNLRLAFNAAYTDAKLTESVPDVDAVNGARLPTAPRWTASGTLDYRFAAIQNWTPKIYTGLRYIDTQYTSVSSYSSAAILPGYTLVDLNASVSNGRYDIALYAKNLTDKRVFSSAKTQTDQRDGSTFMFGSIIQPRMVGISVDVKF